MVRPHGDWVHLENRTVRAGKEPLEHKRSSKKNASMIIGMSMDQEIGLILGQVSLSLLYEMRSLQTHFCGLERA